METKEEKKKLRHEVQQQTAGYLLTALGLVAGLAWNDAVKALIEFVYPLGGDGGISVKFVYAAAITLVVVVVSTYISRLLVKN